MPNGSTSESGLPWWELGATSWWDQGQGKVAEAPVDAQDPEVFVPFTSYETPDDTAITPTGTGCEQALIAADNARRVSGRALQDVRDKNAECMELLEKRDSYAGESVENVEDLSVEDLSIEDYQELLKIWLEPGLTSGSREEIGTFLADVGKKGDAIANRQRLWNVWDAAYLQCLKEYDALVGVFEQANAAWQAAESARGVDCQ